MSDDKLVERLREAVTLLEDVQEASEAPQQLKLAIALGNIDAVLQAQSERASMEGEMRFLEDVEDGLSWNSSAIQCLDRIRQLCQGRRRALTPSKTGDER